MIKTIDDLHELIQEYGFLPLFANEIPGFSVEEHCDPKIWFSDTEEGPWEWKGPVIQDRKSAYGKFFFNKCGFVSKKWLLDFINYRRDGYDCDARYDDGLSPLKDLELYNAINDLKPVTTKQLKAKVDYSESTLTRLQMQTYIVIDNFVYNIDRYGKPYGWGVAVYSTPEKLYGKKFVEKAYQRDPNESKERIEKHMKKLFPDITDQQLKKFIK